MNPVEIVEVGPRDGLQNEERILDTATKVELIHRLMDAGARRIEAVSFVHPARVPQMADAEAVMEQVGRREGVALSGLVLNRRGYERAVAARVDEVNFAAVATETFNQRNQGASIDDTLADWAWISERARREGMRRTVTVGASFGCPFEGEVSVAQVLRVATRVLDAGVDELCLADTIGVGDPMDVRRKVLAVAELGDAPLRCHFHNTRNTGLANALAGVEAGVTVLDASVGGVGGCPFAPAATGNVPTEDLVYMLERMGVDTGFDLAALVATVRFLEGRLGKPVPGMLSKAGLFPAEAAA